MTSVLALVESPAQLLNVLEWAAAHPQVEDLGVVALHPADSWSRVQLRNLAAIARSQGLDVTISQARDGVTRGARELLALKSRVAAARCLILGDPFSRMIQLLVPAADARQVVIVDDGTATAELVRIVRTRGQLARWHKPSRRSYLGARALAWLCAPERSLELFTCVAGEETPGMVQTPNEYAWVRRHFGPPGLRAEPDLVGTSLVETGLISEEHYLELVRSIVDAHGAARYLAHRRENTAKLGAIAEHTGITVIRPDLPLELVAGSGPIGRSIISFPSTVAYTLPVILRGTRAKVEVCEIPPAWLVPATSERALSFLRSVTAAAVQRHGLGRLTLPPGPAATTPTS